jgi:hypothetical protein
MVSLLTLGGGIPQTNHLTVRELNKVKVKHCKADEMQAD